MRHEKITATTVTVLIHAALVVLCLYLLLEYPRPDMPEPKPMQTSELTYIDPEQIEYEFDPAMIDHIMAGEAVDEVTDDPYGGDIPQVTEDAGDTNVTDTPVATPEPSPVKVDDTARRQQAASDKIKDKAANAFGSKNKGDNKQPKDNSRSLTRTIANSPKARSTKTGTITFAVTVNGNGKVVGEPQLVRDRLDGPASQDPDIIARCRAIAKDQTFEVIVGSPNQSGTVTFTFEDPGRN